MSLSAKRRVSKALFVDDEELVLDGSPVENDVPSYIIDPIVRLAVSTSSVPKSQGEEMTEDATMRQSMISSSSFFQVDRFLSSIKTPFEKIEQLQAEQMTSSRSQPTPAAPQDNPNPASVTTTTATAAALTEAPLDSSMASALKYFKSRGIVSVPQQQQPAKAANADVPLRYIDEFGREMTPKEAYKQLSWKFHGKKPGVKKTEKRLRKIHQELKQQKNAN